MSLSPSRLPAAAARPPEWDGPVEPFPYDPVAPGAAQPAAAEGFPEPDGASEAAARQAQVRAQGRQEGLGEARQIFEEQLARERAALAAALSEFARDRARYFQTVEGEVVQLALGIARRILHRESQLDPLLLAGMVRVALEKINGATAVRLRIHPGQAALWRGYLTARLEPADLPEIVADPTQPADRCSLETAMGTAAIGVELQFKEIEQGLMDLLAARPASANVAFARPDLTKPDSAKSRAAGAGAAS